MENTKSNSSPFDKRATLENIRGRYGSVQAFCRQHPIKPRSLYRALHEGWGLKRAETMARGAIDRLRDEGLLVEAS